MSSPQSNRAQEVSLLQILRRDLFVWGPMAFLVFFTTSCLLSGFPGGLTPDIDSPYSYDGDAVSHAWMAQCVTEGWIYNNDRSGYPFGSKFLDYPTCDSGSLLVLKCLGLTFGSFAAAVNLYFLLGFSLSFISGYLVMRALGLDRGLAVAGALLYAFLPYHFLRFTHLFLTYYFQVPFFFYWGYRLFILEPVSNSDAWRELGRKFLPATLVMPILVSFGLYYAFFGGIVLLLGGVAGTLRHRSIQPLLAVGLLGGMLGFGLLLNIAPNIYHRVVNGPNPEVAHRSSLEAEIYGLKIVQLLIPHLSHRNDTLRHLSEGYASSSVLANENTSAALGIVGATGFGLILLVVVMALSSVKVGLLLRFLALTTFVLTVFATTGGLSSLFAVAVTPIIRGWNRCSVFIGFACIFTVFLFLQCLLNRYASNGLRRKVFLGGVAILTVLGFLDQTPAYDARSSTVDQQSIAELKSFVSEIEHTVPRGSAIYQLPYMPFPETPPLHGLGTYELASGMLFSKTLRWSYGGMKGREGDLFFRALSQEPVPFQLEVISRLGFQGIYIDRRGYEDHGQALEAEIQAVTKAEPTLVSRNRDIVFYRIAGVPTLEPLTVEEVFERAKYHSRASVQVERSTLRRKLE